MIKSSCAFVFAYFCDLMTKKTSRTMFCLRPVKGGSPLQGAWQSSAFLFFFLSLRSSFSLFFFSFFCFLPTPHFYSLHSLLFSYVVKTNAFLFLFLSFSGLFTSNMPEIRPIWTFFADYLFSILNMKNKKERLPTRKKDTTSIEKLLHN